MRYKHELAVTIAVLFVLSLAGVASADSITKTLYVDGVKIGNSTAPQPLTFPYQRLTIGAEGSRYFRYNGLIGEIDEFTVFGRVLTDANVTTLHGAGAGGYVAAVNAAAPLLYLRFEDGSSAEGSKLTNNGSLADVNSTYIGAVTQNLTGFVGKSAVLHGASAGTGDCIDVCDWDARLSLSDISVAFWVKTSSSSDYPRLFQHNGGNTEEHSYGAMYSAASIGLIGGGNTGYLNSTIADGVWHHIVITFDSLQPGPYAAEVLADDPCVYMKFDNTEAVDSSINHYWASFGPRAELKNAGGIGMSFYMDNTSQNFNNGHADAIAYVWNNMGGAQVRITPPYGGNDDFYAFVPADPYEYGASGDITFEIWIKSVAELSSETYANIFQQVGHYTREPDAPALGLYTDAGVRKLRVAAGSQWYYPGTDAPFDGRWHQLVVTYDENEMYPGRDMGVQLYLDGSLVGQTIIVDDVNYQALLGPEQSTIQIGHQGDWGYPYSCYSGYVDEFAVYPGVLSAERIATHYAAWQPKDCADVMARGSRMDGDFNGDCQVDLYDYVSLSQQWRICNTPGVSGCIINW